MTRHMKRTIIIILLVCAGITVFAFHTDIRCLWWYVKCRTLEKDNEYYKLEVTGWLEESKAVHVLCWMLKDESRFVRIDAAYRLAKLADKRATEPLIAMLRDIDWEVRYWAAEALDKVGDKRAVESLVTVLQDKNWCVRLCAAIALGNLADKRAVDPLIASLKDKDGFVRLAAVEALGKLGDKRAVKPLIVAMEYEDNIDRSSFQLGTYPYRERLLDLVRRLQALAEPLCLKIAKSLGRLGDKRAIEPLKKMLAVEKYYYSDEPIQAAIKKLESLPDTPPPIILR